MESLPLEVVAQIALYLSVKDLASCCVVSVWWRDVFGSDEVWKPRCDTGMAEYLEATPCRVEPKFSEPLPEETSLSPTGHWRLAFMRETRLWCNWINGNYKEQVTNLGDNKRMFFLDSNILLVLKKNKFMLIDLSAEPLYQAAELKVFLAEKEIFTPTVVKKDMVITVNKENVVQVIDVDLENLKLDMKHSFCIDDSLRGRGDYIQHSVVNTMFLGFDQKDIHIWDLAHGTKLKTEHLTFSKLSLAQSKNKVCEDVVIRGYSDDDVLHFLVYSTKKLKFWPLKVCQNQSDECAIIRDYVAISFGNSLRIYKYKTAQLITSVPMTELIMFSVQNFSNSFVYVNNGVMLQLFPSNGSSRYVMETENFISLVLIREKLVAAFTKENQLQMWRIGPVSTVRVSMPTFGPLEINDTFSKVLLLKCNTSSSVRLLHFW